ncbi:unnamed protein product [Durusdinium trenchii]|uniref:Fe2OG dioxygenase domain-containing protein n=1 Tax=Durusdinium trenchii TaxID=1381693 RepID=A0ABP0S5A6_9DINO
MPAQKAVQALSAKTDAMRATAVPLLVKLEEQVEKLTKLADDYLEQGMLGHYAEAIKMRDSATVSLEGLQQKLGISGEAADLATPTKAEVKKEAKKDAEREAKEDAKRLSERDKDNGKKADAREAKEDTKKAVKDEPNEALDLCNDEPSYRWIAAGEGCVVEIKGPACEADAMPDVAPLAAKAAFVRCIFPSYQYATDQELSEVQARCSWETSAWQLTLPVAFSLDVAKCKVVRRRKRQILELHLTPAPPAPSCGLKQAVLEQGFGWMDGFLAGQEADVVRARLLDLWKKGELNEGEVEGGKRQHLRSDHYLFMQEDDPAVAPFTRRLDQLVLSIAKEVDELKDLWLMRGRPMVAVYAGAGARYTPHFDAVRGDNGRKITCVLYLNPFWKPGDGAELQIFPEAKGISPEGPCHEVQPLHGRLACFLCDSRNLHAVKPVSESAKMPRVAISCWYYDSEGGQFHREDERDALRSRS